MPTDTIVNNLVINELTKAQYDEIENPSDTELYLVSEVIDTAPTSGSDNLVTSGGVYTALSNKANISDIPTVPSNIVTGLNSSGVATAYTIKVVDSLPSTADPSTIYFITNL